jgi:AcrR family transcriptional regulator
MSDRVTNGLRRISRILSAAEKEFGSKGFDAARIDDIARLAGASEKLIYYHYQSKDGLFASLLDEASSRAMSEMVELDLGHLTPPHALRTFLNYHFDQYRRSPLLSKCLMEENRTRGMHISSQNKFPELMPTLVANLKSILDRGAANGEFRAGVDAAAFLATSVLITAGCFVNSQCLSTMMGVDLATAEGIAIWRDHSVEFILASIRAPGVEGRASEGPEAE